MKIEEIKAAVLRLDPDEQKCLILELLTEIMPKVCTDDSCLDKIRSFVDEETIKDYRAQHMDSI